MAINCFALFVNYFGIMGILTYDEYGRYSYLFTHSTGNVGKLGPGGTHSSIDNELGMIYNTFDNNDGSFYPFVNFYREGVVGDTIDSMYTKTIFKGIFPYYDFSEFYIYTALIFIIPLLIKFYRGSNDKAN